VIEVVETWRVIDRWWKKEPTPAIEFACVKWDGRQYVFKFDPYAEIWRVYCRERNE
jgi:hypothetical protein